MWKEMKKEGGNRKIQKSGKSARNEVEKASCLEKPGNDAQRGTMVC